MRTSLTRPRRGFTLIEIMIGVAIVALLAAIATPNFLRARKRAQATRVLNDLRVLDYALDRWALEKSKSIGDTAEFSDLRPYLKDSQMHQSGTDIFGGALGPYSVDTGPRLSASAYNALSDVAPTDFWSPYY